MSVVTELNAFEKLLVGRKTYIVSAATLLYGVIYLGIHQHVWNGLDSSVTYIFAGSTLAVLRAALAEIKLVLK